MDALHTKPTVTNISKAFILPLPPDLFILKYMLVWILFIIKIKNIFVWSIYMAKTLYELANELKELIRNALAGSKDGSYRPEKYNNLKLTMDVAGDIFPQVKISIGISEANYDIKTGEKLTGSLAMEERYVQRWFSKADVLKELQACWQLRVQNRGKITDVE